MTVLECMTIDGGCVCSSVSGNWSLTRNKTSWDNERLIHALSKRIIASLKS